MKILARAARDAGITVPLFTNDGFEEGGWIPRTTFARTGMPHRDQSKGFGIDWYGFDKYVGRYTKAHFVEKRYFD